MVESSKPADAVVVAATIWENCGQQISLPTVVSSCPKTHACTASLYCSCSRAELSLPNKQMATLFNLFVSESEVMLSLGIYHHQSPYSRLLHILLLDHFESYSYSQLAILLRCPCVVSWYEGYITVSLLGWRFFQPSKSKILSVLSFRRLLQACPRYKKRSGHVRPSSRRNHCYSTVRR